MDEKLRKWLGISDVRSHQGLRSKRRHAKWRKAYQRRRNQQISKRIISRHENNSKT